MFDEYNRPQRNFKTGRFLPGCTPFNKGKKMETYLSEEKIAKVKAGLEKGRTGNPSIAGWNRRKVAIFDIYGAPVVFSSSEAAARALGISTVGARNIRKCCDGKAPTAYGRKFYWWDSDEFASAYRTLQDRATI